VLLATIGLSFKAIFIKLVYQADPSIDAVSILAIRFVLSMPFFLLLLLYATRKPSAVPFTFRHVPIFLFLGMLGYYLSAMLDFSALAYIPASLERLILFLYPTFVVIISIFVRPTEVTRAIIVSLAISYMGVALVFVELLPQITPELIKGVLLVLSAALIYAIYIVVSVTPIKQFGSIRFTTYAMFAASISTLGHAYYVHGDRLFDHSLEVYGLMLPMAIVSTVLPLILMAEGIKRIGASSSSVISTSGPLMTVAMAYLILDETFGLLQAIGGMMIVMGVFFVMKKK
jgi:drug/metabolite transporter (DMT)-like permease